MNIYRFSRSKIIIRHFPEVIQGHSQLVRALSHFQKKARPRSRLLQKLLYLLEGLLQAHAGAGTTSGVSIAGEKKRNPDNFRQ